MDRNPLQDLIDVLPEPMLLVSTAGKIVGANPPLLRLLELEASALTDRAVFEIVDDPVERVREFLSSFSGSGQMLLGALTFRKGGDGAVPCRLQGAAAGRRTPEAMPLLVLRLEPRRSAASKFLLLNQKITQLSREIHHRRAVEAELRALNAELEQRVEERTSELSRANRALLDRNRELQDFAHVASHDLQEPLRKIRTFLGLIQDEMPKQSEEVRGYFKRVDHAASRMSRLIRDLLGLSRVATQGATLQPVDLRPLVEEVLLDLEVRIAELDARVEVGALCTVVADPSQMRQLFQNLIVNAIKFHRPDVRPEVRIEMIAADTDGEESATGSRIIVSDNGIGFNERQAERIFMPFQRLHAADAYGGSGIGLATCRRIVDRHGGTIRAVGMPGEGSRFIIDLPAEVVVHQNLETTSRAR